MEGEISFTLGGERITAPPLTIGQIKRICLAIPIATGQGATAAAFDAEVEIIAAACAVARPLLTTEGIMALPSSRREMAEAVRAILVGAEFVKPENDPGEAKAGSA